MDVNLITPIRVSSLSDVVADRLRQAIITGELAPGERLSEPGLATQLGISRSPVREALQILKSEGLVVERSNRSNYVWAPTVADIEEIFSLWAMIETLASEWLVTHLYYFGQEKVMSGPEAIKLGVDNTVDWVLAKAYRNAIIEIDNESNVIYKQPVLLPAGVHELIERAQAWTLDGRRLLVGTSFGGGYIPPANVVKVSDFLLIHGNGVGDPNKIVDMVKEVRQVEGYRPMPVLFNEGDHFDFDKPFNNMIAAVSQYVGWGYFDYRMQGEGFVEGYQSVPVDWGIHSQRKTGFFNLLKEITGE